MTTVEDEVGLCRWPLCEEPGVVGTDPEAVIWWCWDHCTDEHLPKVAATSPIGACEHCKRSATTWVRDEAGWHCVHVEHIRAWAANVVSVEPKGAWARRGKS